MFPFTFGLCLTIHTSFSQPAGRRNDNDAINRDSEASHDDDDNKIIAPVAPDQEEDKVTPLVLEYLFVFRCNSRILL